MDILDFALILIVLFFVINWSGIKCILNPIDCATNKITDTFGGIKSFFSDIANKF